MADIEHVQICLDCWNDAVGAFEPGKVLQQLKLAFPEAEIDPTDHQQVRLLRELEFWLQGEKTAELRESLIRQSWGLYQRNGPTYRFVIPFPSGHRVKGTTRRMSVDFGLPAGLPPEYREQLLCFLHSLRLGEPSRSDWHEKTEPFAEPESASIIVSGDT